VKAPWALLVVAACSSGAEVALGPEPPLAADGGLGAFTSGDSTSEPQIQADASAQDVGAVPPDAGPPPGPKCPEAATGSSDYCMNYNDQSLCNLLCGGGFFYSCTAEGGVAIPDTPDGPLAGCKRTTSGGVCCPSSQCVRYRSADYGCAAKDAGVGYECKPSAMPPSRCVQLIGSYYCCK
jgi:hypothetical protein